MALERQVLAQLSAVNKEIVRIGVFDGDRTTPYASRLGEVKISVRHGEWILLQSQQK